MNRKEMPPDQRERQKAQTVVLPRGSAGVRSDRAFSSSPSWHAAMWQSTIALLWEETFHCHLASHVFRIRRLSRHVAISRLRSKSDGELGERGSWVTQLIIYSWELSVKELSIEGDIESFLASTFDVI